MNKILPESQFKIHLDYCDYELCKFCEYANCVERKEKCIEKFEWTQKGITGIGIRKTNGLQEP
jgi:hypothetical protein